MRHSNNLCYEFGPFLFDVGQRVLTREGNGVSLTPKATDILTLLLRNAGQVVEKEEVMREVWPDTFVEEANVTQNIFTLRRALGDDRPKAKYIETVSRRGYRFVGAVRSIAPNGNASRKSVQTGRDGFSSPPILAVLPFENETGDKSLDYLGDGITDSIINNLSSISKLRVMSRTAVFRYKGRSFDAHARAQAWGVDAMLIGKILAGRGGLTINVELVSVANGWQLWGETFDCGLKDLLQIQDEIAQQLSTTLQLKLTGDEQRSITTRYTENSAAYQAYLEGRYHWSTYTKSGLEAAINHFRRAIDLDPNYALAYSGIVDCYLRLATNYLPPEEEPRIFINEFTSKYVGDNDWLKVRQEWDWRAAERELRRANELKATHVVAHQWYAAYFKAKNLFEEVRRESEGLLETTAATLNRDHGLPTQIQSFDLTCDEDLQVTCAISREQIDVGNFEAASRFLRKWWVVGGWPNVEGLNPQSCLDLLFTAGVLAGCLASAGHLGGGQREGEALLNASLGLCEQQGFKNRASEVRMELAVCYYRQGLFDLARKILNEVISVLSPQQGELKGLALVRLAIVERHAGCFQESHELLSETKEIAEAWGPWVAARYYQELATTLRELALAEQDEEKLLTAAGSLHEALEQFEAVGNFRYVAVVENNFGFLLLCLRRLEEAEYRLNRARSLFQRLNDTVRCAQVEDTLAHLYLATGRTDLAEEAAERAIKTLQARDEEALLAEALRTKGLVLCRQRRFVEAKGVLDGAHRVAERCGDFNGACSALLMILEEMGDRLPDEERKRMAEMIKCALMQSPKVSAPDRFVRGSQLLDLRSKADLS